jgi:hypothetical protein
MTRPRTYDYGKIVELRRKKSQDDVAAEIGCGLGTVIRAMRLAKQVDPALPARLPMRRSAASDRTTKSRLTHPSLAGAIARMPAIDNAALIEGRTIYPTTVVHESEVKRALKSGFHHAKIGAVVMKGRWKGFPIYTLTLEERATCPSSCRHWRSCYGNQMHHAERLMPGPELEWRLTRELAGLDLQHRGGFVVRLHVLGDFYSAEYVAFWADMLDRYKALNVFGYSARWMPGDAIARPLLELSMRRWDRFAIRFSNMPIEHCATRSIEHPYQCPPDAIVCPAQTGRTESCSTCALCWGMTRNIAFLQH